MTIEGVDRDKWQNYKRPGGVCFSACGRGIATPQAENNKALDLHQGLFR